MLPPYVIVAELVLPVREQGVLASVLDSLDVSWSRDGSVCTINHVSEKIYEELFDRLDAASVYPSVRHTVWKMKDGSIESKG